MQDDGMFSERMEWKLISEALRAKERVIGGAEDAINRLMAMLMKLKVFQQLNHETRLEIARRAYFEKEPKKGMELIAPAELHKYQGPWRLVLWGAVEVKVVSETGKTSHDITKGDVLGDELTLRALPAGSHFLTREEGCEFLCLPHEDYKTLLQFQEEEEVERRVQYFQSLLVPIFASWSAYQLREFARRVYPRKYASRQVIVRENEHGSDVYFIVKGECRVVREIEITKGQGGQTRKMVKLLELAVLQPYEYFGELAPYSIQVDANAKFRSDMAKKGGGPRKLPAPTADENDDSDSLSDNDADAANQLAISDTPGTRQATVFSHTPLKLLVLPVEALREFVSGNPLQRLREYAKGYPTASEIREQYTIQHGWAMFKQNLVSEVIRH
eukprot:TRINITY_DN7087_c0_g2_i1.p1 TRINITY_DN7087_c0_g2~~TRINITY_DN7087_c0_g2_i1.p1  ORF type:complete len:417 (+),score=185.16 TRINITY_DN7087_c0_g2_i1:92-1252(+)